MFIDTVTTRRLCCRSSSISTGVRYSNVQRELRARVVELVDTWVLKTHGLWLRGFKSLLAHHNFVPHRGGAKSNQPDIGVVMGFMKFKQAIAKQFKSMLDLGCDLYVVDVNRDELWEKYLASFPEGTNPIHRTRTEHDCSACRHFIKTLGPVVAIASDIRLVSIWDTPIQDDTYSPVASALSDFVKAHPIRNVFRHREFKVGVDYDLCDSESGDGIIKYAHLYVTLPRNERSIAHPFTIQDAVRRNRILSDVRADHDVLARGLDELTLDSLEVVIDLINQGSLYRGQDFKTMLQKFMVLKREYDDIKRDAEHGKCTPHSVDNFVWHMCRSENKVVSRIRNTAIGTLLIDLSADVDLETAVRKYEAVMAPLNYKRPKTLVTKAMVESARKKVEDLGLTSALNRRYAVDEDIDLKNILFVDRSSSRLETADIFDSVETKVKPKKFDRVEEISIKDFIANVLPTVDSVELLVENRHAPNFVSLTTASDPTAGRLFKWDNPFAWAYNGDVTDSIKERVKRAGGVVDAELCCRLSWSNYDDLDLHMREPNGGHIYYGVRKSDATGGQLDIDMNAGHGDTREPVENIFYMDSSTMVPGKYTLYVNQFCVRETVDFGFEVQIECRGETYDFSYDKSMRTGENIYVAEITYDGKDLTVNGKLPCTSKNRGIWGVRTQSFVPVTMVMKSPNYWDAEGVGNLHYFFMLKNCVNPTDSRGFFNEFLRNDLNEHRKVLEIVGSKIRASNEPHQLSGLGFSSTLRNSVLCKVCGKFTRVLKINF